MAVEIHPTAIVEDGAELGADVVIGAYAHIGSGVTLGDRCRILPKAIVYGQTRLGEDVEVHPGAVLGGPPQIIGFKPSPESRLEVGDRTVLREQVTLHTGSPAHGGVTRVGSDCLMMTETHLAHDGQMGNHCVVANNSHLAGHVKLGDHVWVGGGSAVHQWCRIGDHAFVGGGSILVSDLIPYGSSVGNHAKLAGLNIVGLKRRGFSREALKTIRAGFNTLFSEDGTFSDRLERTETRFADSPEVMKMVNFIRDGGNRSLCHPR